MRPFVDRHVGPQSADVSKMLSILGYESTQELISQAVPSGILLKDQMNLPTALSESEVLDLLREKAARNRPTSNLIGQGYYGTITPMVIQRNILENPAWYTAYTPYQPEISQGRLEALLNFQTVVTDLTGLDIAGASLLDEPTAAAEAMTLMLRQSKKSGMTLLVDEDTHPQTLTVLNTRAVPLGITVSVSSVSDMKFNDDVFGALISYPGSSGEIRSLSETINAAHDANVLVALATDLLVLTHLQTPGEIGADIAIGSAQRFGVPMGFGGPHAGFMAVRSGLERSMPGRLVGVSVDSHGDPAYRLALQTREQHIRREKATSNICTAQALLAICASMYASYHGYSGLRSIAQRNYDLAHSFADSLRGKVTIVNEKFFDTVTFEFPQAKSIALNLAKEHGINLRIWSDERVSVSCDETTTVSTLEIVAQAFGGDFVFISTAIDVAIRSTDALSHPVFHVYQSETEMMRYLRKLSDRDLALDRTMIPLGSCTMKLNAATEMSAITWPEFAHRHPYAPESDNLGYLSLINELEQYLCEITGYDAVSLQPNAGSQGEFAGLLAVAAYHESRGEVHRNVCLIPSSAHGTNAASAVMAGMQVVVVACDQQGNVDMNDLRSKIGEHTQNLAALMITYPSTHGVYEETVSEICALVHEAGGQVYVDGANLNALVGIAKPGKFGADVSHLNLHKTFCIPHGGGGPGVGPVAVRAHLAPFLPGDPLVADSRAVSGAKFGSAGILPIPYAYIRMMGAEALRTATEVAVVSANYIARKLEPKYPVLYTNHNGLVAHECIIDIREITKRSGVTNDDIAKRLIDYGFHAPTMSFPVAGTLMIEPTESESLYEVDRFIDAMLNIANEIDAIEKGEIAYAESALHHAPHTAKSLLASHEPAENRLRAGLPHGVDPKSKYWPPVGRIDGAFGDRNLVCTCPPIEDFAD
jgi:glycine dehydrogenase